MDITLNLIKRYLEEEETDYAIMLNGEWGTGKTYYIRKLIKAELEKIQIPNKKDKTYKLIYISLNGIDNKNEIFNQIASEKFQVIKSKYVKTTFGLINTVANVFNTDLKNNFNIEDVLDLSDNILCFDDLERVSSTLDIKDILGFISSNFTEKNKIKTLIIANEKIINDQEKVNENEISYDLIKEKFIDRTIEYKPNIYSTLKNFVAGREVLSNRLEIIWSVVCKTQSNNIRKLRFALNNLEEILLKIEEFEIDDFIEEIILFTISLSYEYKDRNFGLDNIICNYSG